LPLISLRHSYLGFVLSGALLFSAAPAQAQNIFDFFQKGQGNPFAPVDNGGGAVPPNLTINPVSPDLGSTPKKSDAQSEKAESDEQEKPIQDIKKARLSPAQKRALAKKEAAEKALADKKLAEKKKTQTTEEDEDEDALYEYETPQRVTILLPIPRPGATIRAAADVAPVGSARWNAGKEQLPPGVNFRDAVTIPPNPALPGATRVASLPQTQSVPRWTSSDLQPLRPAGLRDVETPVANMPGVFAPPDANFQCLPVGVKQVLVDTAKQFGHVAILNAKRPRGTGARASYHYQCRAVDFRVRGVPVRTVYNFLKEHPNVGGRKIYPFGFFHVDDGPVRSW
jgi:Bacterial protein of unknown function (DUF882)